MLTPTHHPGNIWMENTRVCVFAQTGAAAALSLSQVVGSKLIYWSEWGGKSQAWTHSGQRIQIYHLTRLSWSQSTQGENLLMQESKSLTAQSSLQRPWIYCIISRCIFKILVLDHSSFVVISMSHYCYNFVFSLCYYLLARFLLHIWPHVKRGLFSCSS